MLQDYAVWVIIDPTKKDWFTVQAETIQGAAEVAALTYDQRSDVDFALTKESTIVQVLVQNPDDNTKAFSFEVSCTLNPFYEIVSGSSLITL